MSDKRKWTVGYGSHGISGPTTASVRGPTVAGRDWGHEIVSNSLETLGIFPNQDDGYGGQVAGSGAEHARLFAAAPDLLEALEEAVKCGMVPKSSALEGGASRHARQAQVADMIRAAISKAKGDPQ